MQALPPLIRSVSLANPIDKLLVLRTGAIRHCLADVVDMSSSLSEQLQELEPVHCLVPVKQVIEAVLECVMTIADNTPLGRVLSGTSGT